MTEPFSRPTVPLPSPDPPIEAFPEEAMKKEWLDGVRHLSEAIWNSLPSTIIPYSIRGIAVEAHFNAIMEVNAFPWHLEYTFFW